MAVHRAEEVKRNPGCQYRGNITNQTQKTRHLFWLQQGGGSVVWEVFSSRIPHVFTPGLTPDPNHRRSSDKSKLGGPLASDMAHTGTIPA